MQNKELQVGDKIYAKGRYGITKIYTIDRVTPTQAMSGSDKFRRPIVRGLVSLIGEKSIWNMTSYYLETESLIQELKHQKNYSEISSVKWDKVPAHKIEEILTIINQPIK